MVFFVTFRNLLSDNTRVRDRPFNLKGGGMVFLFRSEIFSRSI